MAGVVRVWREYSIPGSSGASYLPRFEYVAERRDSIGEQLSSDLRSTVSVFVKAEGCRAGSNTEILKPPYPACYKFGK